jgi:hypothetical protein
MKTLSHMQRNLNLRLTGAVMLSLALLAGNAKAQVVDSDNDGFSDSIETTGFILSLGLNNANGTNSVSLCGAGALATDPCVHPAGPDLFVILVPATPSLIPSNPLLIVPTLLSGGLGAHQLTQASATTSRIVTTLSGQNAVRVSESLDTNDVIWGRSLFQGNPNTAGEATVFTQRIKNAIITAYQQAGVINAAAQQADIDKCIRHTVAHESGHNTLIASQYNSRYGGYHYAASSQVVMSQNATITTKPGKVNVICPQVYASPDAAGFRLK